MLHKIGSPRFFSLDVATTVGVERGELTLPFLGTGGELAENSCCKYVKCRHILGKERLLSRTVEKRVCSFESKGYLREVEGRLSISPKYNEESYISTSIILIVHLP